MKIRFTAMGRIACMLGAAALVAACCAPPATAAERIVLGEEFTNTG